MFSKISRECKRDSRLLLIQIEHINKNSQKTQESLLLTKDLSRSLRDFHNANALSNPLYKFGMFAINPKSNRDQSGTNTKLNRVGLAQP